VFDNARAALKELSDDGVFERVAVYVLRARHAELRLTGPSGDLGRDGFGRRLFGVKDEVVLMTSLEQRWTAKLRRELANIKSQPRKDRARKAIFVTNQSADQKTQTRYKGQARALGVTLEVFDLNELVLELDGDALRWVAENELGVRPRQPRVLAAPAEFFEQLSRSVPGVDAAVVGRDDVLDRIKVFVANQDLSAPRVLVVAGRGGVGKTRVAVEGAFQAATTLIARTATRVDGGALTAVPLGDPAVLVVDDAHRSRDLSGLAAMVGDSRFDRVKIILTVRPGLQDLALESAGLGGLSYVSEDLRSLDRADIDAIIVGHGINDPEFVRAVVTLAEGSPLVAHAACELATTQNSFNWGDAAGILEDYVVKRLLATADDETRAAAVALAVLSSAEGGEDLARLASAVTSLPADTGRLDTILADLADMGLADAGVHRATPATSPTFTVCPHLAAPLLVAQALSSSARVRLKVEQALPVLGRAALRSSGGIDRNVAFDKEHSGGVLGIGMLNNGSLTGTWLNTSVLASQLQVLSQAAVRMSDSATAAQLYRAVRELLPKDADADVWRDVLVLAEQVVPAAPAMLDYLRAELRRQWPPPPTQPLWGEQPADLHRFDIQQIAEQVRQLVLRSGSADPPAATQLLLTVAALASAYLDARQLGDVLRGIGNLAVPGGRLEMDTLFTRRDQVLNVVVAWARDELAALPTGSERHSEEGRGGGCPTATVRVLMAALRPFLTPIIESASMGTRDAADVLVLKNWLLPNDPRTSAGLASAADAVTMLADHLDVRDEASAGVLRHLVNLPRELRGTGARGLPRADGPLPAYARRALADAAATIRGAVASRWDDLPLWARHAAAAASVRGTGGSGRSLAQRAAAGDVVAAVARDDDELARMIVLLPVERDLHAYLKGGPGWDRTAKRKHAAAAALARELPWPEAVDLLEASRDVNADFVGDSPRCVFAEHLGRHLDDPAQANALLGRLVSSATIPREREVLASLLQAHPHLVKDWLLEVCTTWRGAELGLAILPHLEPGPVQDAVLDAAHDLVVTTTLRGSREADKASASAAPEALLGAAAQVGRRLVDNIRHVRPPSIGSMLKSIGNAAISTRRRVLRSGPRATLAASAAALGRTRDAAVTLVTGALGASPAEAAADGVVANDRDAAYALGAQLAMALFRGTGDSEARTARLVALGLDGPPDLVPRVLQLATYAIRHPASGDNVIVVSPAQMAGLVEVLQRRLVLSEDIRLDLDTDHDTAYAVAALIEVCPDELADLVAARLLGSAPHGGLWPFAWRDAVGSLEPAARAPFAAALRARLDAARAEPPLDDEVHAFYVDQVLGRIAAGTDGWPETLMGWAQGGPADRGRAAASVAKAWRLPVWASVVSALLTAGLGREDRDVLLRSIEITSFGPDIAEQATRRLEALRRLEPADDPAVQEFKATASSRLTAAVEDYQRDAELRRRGYR
jgi:hypothetical protein